LGARPPEAFNGRAPGDRRGRPDRYQFDFGLGVCPKAKPGKLELPLSVVGYVKGLQRLEGLEIQSVDVRVWLDNLALECEQRDPADRFGCVLVSSDRVIWSFIRKQSGDLIS
jgi:hypothetical protein